MVVKTDYIESDIGRAIHQPAWELLASHEDKDDTTVLDFDTGTMPVHNVLMVVLQVQEQAGVVNDLALQLNNDGSANYEYTTIAYGGVTARTTGATSGLIGAIVNNREITANVILRGGNVAMDPANNYPTWGVQGAGQLNPLTIMGNLVVGYADVDRIRIFTADNATGRLKIYGMNL